MRTSNLRTSDSKERRFRARGRLTNDHKRRSKHISTHQRSEYKKQQVKEPETGQREVRTEINITLSKVSEVKVRNENRNQYQTIKDPQNNSRTRSRQRETTQKSTEKTVEEGVKRWKLDNV